MAHHSSPPNRHIVATAIADRNFDVRARLALTGWCTLAVFLAMSVLLVGCGRSSNRTTAASSAKPEPNLSPQDVVRIQVESLQEHDDQGIATVYRFASPDNRLATGPLSRFAKLFETPSYQALREAASTEYFEMEIDGDSAMQIVALTNNKGIVSFYLFQLTRQSNGSYDGCWMTDGVAPSFYRMGPTGESISNS